MGKQREKRSTLDSNQSEALSEREGASNNLHPWCCPCRKSDPNILMV
jgi:hypothetical protein